MGQGVAVSDGVWRGEVANIDKTVESILKAVNDIDKNVKIQINQVYVGIAGQHIRSMQHRGILTREQSETEITKEDVKNLIRDMHKLAMSPGERIIHVLPQEFYVDSLLAKNDPIGMCGSRLEANFHIITGKVAAAQNIQRCVEKSGLQMDGLILEPLASAAAVLDEDEKEAGVALVDIGGGTTDLAIFQDGIIRHTCVIPFGGNIITEDIREGCKIMRAQAEQLKVKFGSALAIDTKENQVISIPGLKGRPPKEISMRNLASIIQARMEEIFAQVYFEIKASGYLNKLNAGIVITGGGSQLKSIKQLVEYVTGLEARIGHPIEQLAKGYNQELMHPKYATGIGLLVKAFEDDNSQSQGIKIDTFDTTVQRPKQTEEPRQEEDVIQQAKKTKINGWWKDMIKKVPDWLMEENENDFKD
ncbi:MAG: cell division protein FtsA [Chitinophagales bacterium]|nr:cell division protein FtsA [Chitinophagales bacterium]